MRGKYQLDAPGYFEWAPGPVLAWIHVISTDSHEWVYQPTEEDIEKLAASYDLPYKEILEIVNSKKPETHGLVIDVEKFLAARKGLDNG